MKPLRVILLLVILGILATFLILAVRQFSLEPIVGKWGKPDPWEDTIQIRADGSFVLSRPGEADFTGTWDLVPGKLYTVWDAESLVANLPNVSLLGGEMVSEDDFTPSDLQLAMKEGWLVRKDPKEPAYRDYRLSTPKPQHDAWVILMKADVGVDLVITNPPNNEFFIRSPRLWERWKAFFEGLGASPQDR